MPRNNKANYTSTWKCPACGATVGGVGPQQRGSLWCFCARGGKTLATPGWMDPVPDPRYPIEAEGRRPA